MSKMPNIEGEIIFSKGSRMNLFLKLCENGEIPLKFDMDMINKSKKTIFVWHYIMDNRLLIYILHFISIIDVYAQARIKLIGKRKKVELGRRMVKIYDLVETPKLTGKYSIPKSEEYFFNKKIYEITKDKKLGRKIMVMKLKMGDKNGTQSINR